MRFAVIGDIHSNDEALKSVLEAIAKQHVDFIVSTGDLVGYLPFPNEVITRMRQAHILSVQGNHDKVIAEADPVTQETLASLSVASVCAQASAKYTNAVLTDENRAYLKGLPTQMILEQGTKRIGIVHGSPDDISEYLYEDSEALTALSVSGRYDVLICGHTHLPYYRQIGATHFINPGSVGKPKHGNAKSSYAIVTVEEAGVTATFEEVAYDVTRVTTAIKKSPYIANALVEALEKGC